MSYLFVHGEVSPVLDGPAFALWGVAFVPGEVALVPGKGEVALVSL